MKWVREQFLMYRCWSRRRQVEKALDILYKMRRGPKTSIVSDAIDDACNSLHRLKTEALIDEYVEAMMALRGDCHD